MSTTAIIIIAAAGVCFVYFISTQRKLVSLQEMMRNSLGQINAQLQTRWDGISALVQMTKQYAEHEFESLVQIIRERKSVTVNSADDLNAQTKAMDSILGRINVVAEQYPDLKANQMFLSTMDGIKGYEENVRLSRMVYNDSVTKLNVLVRQWPSSFVASILGFQTENYIETEEAQTHMPDIAGMFNK